MASSMACLLLLSSMPLRVPPSGNMSFLLSIIHFLSFEIYPCIISCNYNYSIGHIQLYSI